MTHAVKFLRFENFDETIKRKIREGIPKIMNPKEFIDLSMRQKKGPRHWQQPGEPLSLAQEQVELRAAGKEPGQPKERKEIEGEKKKSRWDETTKSKELTTQKNDIKEPRLQKDIPEKASKTRREKQWRAQEWTGRKETLQMKSHNAISRSIKRDQVNAAKIRMKEWTRNVCEVWHLWEPLSSNWKDVQKCLNPFKLPDVNEMAMKALKIAIQETGPTTKWTNDLNMAMGVIVALGHLEFEEIFSSSIN